MRKLLFVWLLMAPMLALAEGGITVMHGVPAMYAKLLDRSHEPGRTPTAPTLRVEIGRAHV